MSQGSFVRRRPREFDGGSKAEQAVFAATEKLLAETTLNDLTVAQILREGKLSRANFYHYFANKYDVLVALLGRVFDDSYGQEGPWSTSPGRDRARRMGSSLENTLAMWSEHGAVICSVIEHMHTEPPVAAAWQRMFARFVGAIAEQIEFERAEGRAPDGPPAEMIAAMLVGAAERVFYVTTRELDPRLPSVDSLVSPLQAVTEAAIYGGRSEPDETSAATIESVSVDLGVIAAQTDPDPVPDTAQGILDAMRELLSEYTLAELSVAKILERAGISRASFYFYFRSKEDAFVVLFREAARDVVGGFASFDDTDRDDPAALLGQVGVWLDLRQFGAVIRNAVHIWPRMPELRSEYLAAMNSMESILEAVLSADRARGASPAGPPVPQYAATILWTIERAVAGALAGEAHLQDLDTVTELVGRFLSAALYGRR
ncbi:TetR/AcrR family transcriptional regulator [Gordonia sp. NPDC003376]